MPCAWGFIVLRNIHMHDIPNTEAATLQASCKLAESSGHSSTRFVHPRTAVTSMTSMRGLVNMGGGGPAHVDN